MPEIRAPDKKDLAQEDYLKGMKYKDLAEKYGVTINTIKSWKQRYKWDRKSMHTKTEKGAHKKEASQSQQNNHENIEIDNPELTEMQRLFCLYYIKNFNATLSAIKAGYSPQCAHVEGSRLLRNAKVAAEIRKLKGKMTEEIFIDAMDVLENYIKIAFSDITDYLTFGQREVQVMGPFGPLYEGKGKNKKPILKIVNYIDFQESTQIDGTIISEVKQGKEGISIKMADKMKALDKLAEYFDLFPDKFKRKIEEEKLKLDKIKITGDGQNNDQQGVNNFISATNKNPNDIKAMFEGEVDETV